MYPVIKKEVKFEVKEGIVGLKNNSLYCYMNACLQCLLPINQLRDYYLILGYSRFGKTETLSDKFDYSNSLA